MGDEFRRLGHDCHCHGPGLPAGVPVVGERTGLSRTEIYLRVEESEMTPNDLYSECAPKFQKRKPCAYMLFPLRQERGDRFLAPPTPAQYRAGNAGMLASRHVIRGNARAAAMLERMGL